MAQIEPLRTLRYDPRAVGGLDRVVAPPYDVIDDTMRAELTARSPFNVVHIDLPSSSDAGDPYLHAETTIQAWRQQGILVGEREPAIWALVQDYTAPDGRAMTRRGFLCRVRVEDYGAGRIRPHERTQPGPKEDRLRLTRAARANLSPIFSLFPDGRGAAWGALEPHTAGEPFGEATDADGTRNRLWRVADPDAIGQVQEALGPAELLIADGHHRYETARVYALEVGGEGEHRWTLMFLCALEDPGLTVFPTHRLLTGLADDRRQALRETIERLFEVEPLASADELEPEAGGDGRIAFGYLDRYHRRPLRLTLRDAEAVERVLPDKPASYRALDTAVLEALVLAGALGMSEDDVANQRGLTYAKSTEAARAAVEQDAADAAFFLRATPVEQVREVAATGEPMPPKSTFFYPKIPTGLVFNPLE